VAQQPQSRFRRFLPTLLGRVLLLLLALGVVFATYAYVSSIIAIPAILVFGLAIPIWAGIKRPRYLAASGLVIVLAVAPLATVVFTQEIMTPVGVSASATGAIFSNGGPVMQNASVSPFTGSTDTNFTWTVTVFPANRPVGNATPSEIDLFISTCPGATGNNSPYCSSPYPLTILKDRSLPNQTQPYTVTFHDTVGSNGIWAWQMGIYTNNSTTGKPYFQLLVGDPTYNGIEGPVIGGFGVVYTELLPEIYFEDLLLLGGPYFGILLVYMVWKNRERRRKETQQRAPGPVPPVGQSESTAASTTEAPLPSAKSTGATRSSPPAVSVAELNCPKCNAVVYAGETSCWKCGATLPSSASGAGKTGT